VALFCFPGLSLNGSASGGGFRFLYNLKSSFVASSIYTSLAEADTLIFNSHHWFHILWSLPSLLHRKSYRILLRVDGPLTIARSSHVEFILDFCIFLFAYFFADGLIFQSNWSRTKFCTLFPFLTTKNIVIHNGVSQAIFSPFITKSISFPISIVSASWSPNPNKGFDRLTFLDEHLDFDQFRLSFCGNSPVSFKNIKVYPAMNSSELASFYSTQHIFLQTSYIESCSNALIEAISCGLYPIVPFNSSHPEMIPLYGSLYKTNSEILTTLNNIISNPSLMQSESLTRQASSYNIDKTASLYIDFADSLSPSKKSFVFLKTMLIFFSYSIYHLCIKLKLFTIRFSR